MLQELKFQLSTAILTVLTIAAVVAAILNFQQLSRFHLPEDGVVWVNAPGAAKTVEVLRIAPGGTGEKAGLRPGDIVLRINGARVEDSLDVTKILVGIPVWTKAIYQIRRNGVEVRTPVIVGEAQHGSAVTYQYLVGAAYLLIGLFVYFRRGSAYKARHFYIFCLASFIFCAFHYTGKLNSFDKAVYWSNIVAWWLAPTLFLHFCLTFADHLSEHPAESRRSVPRGLKIALLYAPGAIATLLFLGVTSGLVNVSMPLVELRYALDRGWMALLTVLYLASGLVLALEYRRAEDPILRHQLKWLRNGTLAGFLPFAFFYALPYIAGANPDSYMKFGVLSLPLIPLTLAYAIVRYRLMDVDIIFRRGYAYTIATLCVLAAFYGLVFSLGSLAQKNFKDLGSTGLMAIMLIAAFLFQPIRNWIQDRLDKYFYRDRYDYRRTLIEFARELNSETDPDTMLTSVADRLMQTLSIRHVAFFLADEGGPEQPPNFQLKKSMGAPSGSQARALRAHGAAEPLDLSFLNWERTSSYLFFDRTRFRLDAVSQGWPASVKRTIADLDLTYYLPCTVRGRTIAYIGVSRTEDGDFLSSEDVELLVTLSGYVGIAIENANLYRSLQRKVDEYERLKEFSENIVESINVGILAADLEDRVESWNTQMEQFTGVRREQAVGRRLSELFPAELTAELDRMRGETGIDHIYKFPLRRNGATGNGGTQGAEATLNIAVAPLISKDYERIGRLVIFDDITDRAELERKLLQADKLSSIGLLAAGIAHEVNTPLAVISTYAQMLAKQVANDEQKSRMLDKIASQTFRASEIVNSLLNFSRTSSKDVGEVNVNRVIQETVSLLEHQLKKAGILVQLNLSSSLAPISGNAGKLQQVFLNLFINARDAMSPGGTLDIATGNGDGAIHIDVSDTGHGIAPEHLDRIYDPFFTTKSARKGTGLGLSVTYGIIQEHAGTIEAFNRPAGGTRFHLELPCVAKAVNA